MPKIFPLAGLDRRVVWLRLILLGGCFFGMIASLPLWTSSHEYPMVPIDPAFPILGSPWDKFLLAILLLSLVCALWFYEMSVKFFLIVGVFAFCEDQNRGQPWFYMYWVMLWLTLLPGTMALAACRWSISVAYLWSGIQKLNPGFFARMPGWFTAPALNWHLPAFSVDLLRWGVTCTPFLELGIGLGLWNTRFRTPAIIATVLVHSAALLFLGPLGYNYNWVVWPWNLAMIGLVCALFLKTNANTDHNINTVQTFAAIRKSPLAAVILALYSFLPILSYAGMWDSYFSFALYSENAATANIFVTQEFSDRLPPNMKALVKPFPTPFDPQYQGKYYFLHTAWCYQELHVPPMPEPRAFRVVYKELRKYSRKPGDLRMIIGQRSGPVIFYEGDHREYLTPK